MACPTAQRVGTCGATIASLCPLRPFRTGSRLGGKKAQARMDTDFLDWALADFSGYVAADELYDGPFCILSAVDNRASITGSATPFCFCTTQKHLAVKRVRSSMT